MRESSKHLAPWRATLEQAARPLAIELGQPLTGALEVRVTFYLERPRSIKISDRPLPIVKPDLDKLARTLDSLTTARLISDDALIVKLNAKKRYADTRQPGARIRIYRAK
jgi:Holliday junction resolvase RusA-like endonuclease